LRKLGDKYRKGKMQISNTKTIEDVIADEEKVWAENKASETRKQAASGEDRPEFDWSETEDMKTYYNAMFKQWIKSKQGTFGAALAAVGDLIESGKAWLRRQFN